MENLLQKLHYVRSLIVAMDKLNKEEKQYLAQIQQTVPTKQLKKVPEEKRNVHVLVLVFAVILLFSSLFRYHILYQDAVQQVEMDMSNDRYSWMMNHEGEEYPGYDGKMPTKGSIVVKTLLTGIPRALIYTLVIGIILNLVQKHSRKSIDTYNRQVMQWNEQSQSRNILIEQHNQKMNAEIEKLHRRKWMISEEYQKNVLEWFPKDYGYLSAVDYFINQVENHMIDNMQDAVKQYEDYLFKNEVKNHQKLMLKKEEELIRQQMIGNAINAVSMVANVVTSFNTASIADSTSSIADSAKRGADALEDIRRY